MPLKEISINKFSCAYRHFSLVILQVYSEDQELYICMIQYRTYDIGT